MSAFVRNDRRSGYKTWIEISSEAILQNFFAVSELVKPAFVIPIIKSNAYGHGLLEVAMILRERAKWFGVDSIDEALTLRHAGFDQKILILGMIPLTRIREAIENNFSFVVYSERVTKEILHHASEKFPAHVHFKIETGLNRQGINGEELHRIITMLQRDKWVHIEGVSTHFANIEDVNNSTFARRQIKNFHEACEGLRKDGVVNFLRHTACSSAALLFPETRLDAIRLGISLYGLWPSLQIREEMCKKHPNFTLQSALSWKTLVAQVKDVSKGSPIGYGLTERVERKTRVAILPVGYYEGFDRGLSRIGEVLVRGHRCRVLGRVCMNMCMIDVIDTGNAHEGDEAVLIGQQGEDCIDADQMAKKIGTISYEVIARINPLIPRVVM